MENKLHLKVLDIAYEPFDESIWELTISALDLRVRCGDNCLTTEDHLVYRNKSYDAPLGLEFVQIDACPPGQALFEIQERAPHLRSGSEMLVSGRIKTAVSEDLLLLESRIPLYLHVEAPHTWKSGDFVQARGLLCIVLEET